MVAATVLGALLAVGRLSRPPLGAGAGHRGDRVLPRGAAADPDPVLPARTCRRSASRIGPFGALALGLTLYNMAVLAEIFRAGILSVDRGQREAAFALGMRKSQVMTLVLLPQAVRRMLPVLIAQLVVLLKDSSLGFIVGYFELLRQARSLVEFFNFKLRRPVHVPALRRRRGDLHRGQRAAVGAGALRRAPDPAQHQGRRHTADGGAARRRADGRRRRRSSRVTHTPQRGASRPTRRGGDGRLAATWRRCMPEGGAACPRSPPGPRSGQPSPARRTRRCPPPAEPRPTRIRRRAAVRHPAAIGGRRLRRGRRRRVGGRARGGPARPPPPRALPGGPAVRRRPRGRRELPRAGRRAGLSVAARVRPADPALARRRARCGTTPGWCRTRTLPTAWRST